MKKTKWLYVAMGFVAGVAYLIACGSATDVSKSLAGDPTGNESAPETSASLAGTWSGETTIDEGTFKVSITINADGSYGCSGDTSDENSKTNTSLFKDGSLLCKNPTSWELVGNRAIKFVSTQTVSSGCSSSGDSADECPPPSSTTVTKQIIIPILFVDSTNLQLLTYYNDAQFGVTTLQKI